MARKLLFLFRPTWLDAPEGHQRMTPRTSQTDPLQIATVEVGEGAVGLTLCPGKKGDSLFGRPWQRDLVTDVEAIRSWGARVVVTLIEEHEFPGCACRHSARRCEQRASNGCTGRYGT